MLGHGCPADRQMFPLFRAVSGRERGTFVPLRAHFAAWICALLFAAVSSMLCSPLFSDSPLQGGADSAPLCLNISWSSDEPRHWKGEIRLSSGFFANPVPLGGDLGASVTFFSGDDPGTLLFSDPVSTAYCGVQVTAVMPASGKMSLSFDTDGVSSFSRSFSRADLETGAIRIPFDGDGHDLIIEQVPGTAIPLSVVRLGKDGTPVQERSPSMVFEEGETLLLRIPTRYLPKIAGDQRLILALKPSGKDEVIWSDTVPLSGTVDDEERSMLEIPVPIRGIEGAFDIVLELAGEKNGKGNFFNPQKPFSSSGKEVPAVYCRRVIQGIALSNADEKEEPVHYEVSDWRDTLLETIDPTNPSWWKIFARRSDVSDGDKKKKNEGFEPGTFADDFLKMWEWGELQASVKSFTHLSDWGRWDSLWQRPLGSGHLAPFDSNDPRDASFIQLLSSGDPADPSWESYTVPIKEPGCPHLLEIEYLSDYPQKLGVSILEPSVTGGLFPRTIDAGLIVGTEPLADQLAHRSLRYSILFWPKTTAPTVLLINRDAEKPAVYGRIRVYRAKDQFEPLLPPDKTKRSMTAVMSRPTFCDQFSAKSVPATAGVVGARDWSSFEVGAKRMTGYLKSCGWDSLLLSVMGDGSALYPSPIIRPNPLFDSGVFLTEGNDPVRKDVADYLFRLFEREELSLIPLLSFNAPLPLLEKEIRSVQNGEKTCLSDAYYLLDPKGNRYTVTENGKTSVPYNILHPSVQREILRCLDEFAARYAKRPNLGDIALDISPDTFVRLPDNLYTGLDDETIARFARETKLEERCPEKLKDELRDFINASDDGRYYRRAVMIRNYLTEDWMRWRALTVCRFCSNAALVLKRRIPDARLLLVTAHGENTELSLSAAVSDSVRGDAERNARLRHGFDPQYLNRCENVVLVGAVAAGSGGEEAALESEVENALFYQDTVPLNIPSFDRMSPYHPTVTQIAGQAARSDYQNREKWANQLAACDTRRLMNGGEMITMGEEESLSSWIAAFRALPDAPFTTYRPESGTVEPIVLRYRNEPDGLWMYLVNNVPFHCGVTLTIDCSPRAEVSVYAGDRDLTDPKQKNDGIRWTCSMNPYDLIAVKIADPNASINQIETSLPAEICGEGGRLEKEASLLLDRFRLAAGGVELPVRNGGFEENELEPSFSGVRPADSGARKGGKPILGLDIPKMNLLRNPFADEKSEETEEISRGTAGFPAGWHRIGSPDFDAAVDSAHFTQGDVSLKMTSAETAGGVAGDPFPLPKTGRLYVDAKFGIPAETGKELPLYVTLAGKQGGELWQKRLYVGGELLKRAEMERSGTQNTDGVVWVRGSFLFDRLPIEETGLFTVRFELLPHASVWIDDVHFYKLAFDQTEQESLGETIQGLETALANRNTPELLRYAVSPAASLLAEELPIHSPDMARRIAMHKTEEVPEEPETPKEEGEEKPEEEKGFLKKLFPW